MAPQATASAVLLFVTTVAAVSNGANPIRKVVGLLQDMQKEIAVEGAKEKELFDKFMCFCQGNSAEMETSIANAKGKIEEIEGKLKSDSAEKVQLELDVVQHKKDQAAAEQDLEKASTIRSKEASDFGAESAEAKTNIEALAGAVISLGKGMGGELLVQVPGLGSRVRQIAESYVFTSEDQRREFAAFLDTKKGDYAPQGGQIVGIIKSMKDEMEENLKKSEADDALSAKGFAELKETKDGEVSLASGATKSKETRIGELAVALVTSQDDLEDTQSELADTQKFLAGLEEACPSKQKEWDEREKSRAEEVSAISQAIDILNSDDALETFKKAVPASFVEEGAVRRFGFLQQQDSLASRVHSVQVLLAGVAGNREHSQRMKLALYVARTRLRLQARLGSRGAFGNITGMVDEMVNLEVKEQEDDNTQKPWCNGEFDKEAREEAGEKTEISGLEAEMAEVADTISGIDEEVASLREGIAELDKSVAEATATRKEEHAECQASSAMMRSAVELIGRAKNKLQKVYNPSLYKQEPVAEEAAELLQIDARRGAKRAHYEPPEMPALSFGDKKTEKSGGVMALMDSIAREIEGSIRDAEHDEATSQKDYVTLMEDSQATREQDGKSITNKEAAKAELTAKKTVAKEKEQGDVKDLDILHKYATELHGSCDFIIENFDIRKEARTAEVESLKNAKAMLMGATGMH